MKVPFLDLGAAIAELRAQISNAFDSVLDGGWFIGGPALERFEGDYADFCEARSAVGAGNGLDALRLALTAMDIGPGDEVVLAANGFIATFLAVSMTGATPVPVEPDPRTHNLDPVATAAAIGPNTRVILPTHLYGQPASLDPLLALARKHDLRLLEDAAQAHGARYKGRRIGAHGDAATWSFYPSKNLGALGDGGAVTTDDPTLAARIRALANYGSTERYIHHEKGFNSRLDPLHAAALSAKLPLLDMWNDRRRRVAARYREELADCGIGLPHVPDEVEPVWHLFVVTCDERSKLADFLREREIETLIHYPVPPHLQAAYTDLGFERGAFPIAERLAETVVSLPIGPHIDDEQIDHVVRSVRLWSRAGR